MGKIFKEHELTHLSEPKLSARDWEDFEKAIVLFNDGQFWESHEAWEEIWQRHSENNRIFFQGLIQLAAGLHQLHRQIYHGAVKHYRNALWKLKRFEPTCVGLPVSELVLFIESGLDEMERLGPNRLDEFNPELIPKIKQLVRIDILESAKKNEKN